MSNSDRRHFNCSEEYEVDYVASKFTDSQGAKQKIKELCTNGIINYSTHEEVYQLLINAGYTKK